MEDHESIYITINHLDDYMPVMNLKVGDILTLKKEPGNIYDDEAIAVYTRENFKCGYVANSVSTVARGTFSAGRAYDKVKNNFKCSVEFILSDDGVAIARLKKENGTGKSIV